MVGRDCGVAKKPTDFGVWKEGLVEWGMGIGQLDMRMGFFIV